ncbi:hypothetical protein LBMAG49_24560 [Planctomycetota bacterium]|nr:hypothetical protein LBMAG49_24560 [Planctomycetota bacterium]
MCQGLRPIYFVGRNPFPNPLRIILHLLLATVFAVVAVAQTQQRKVFSPQEFTGPQDDSLYSVTRSQEDIHEWEQAREELANGEAATAVERLHRLLQRDSGGVVPIGPFRFAAQHLAALMTLANLPATAQLAYEQLVLREAGALASLPLKSLTGEQLRTLADRFPTSALGRNARMRLGDLDLERGFAVTAAQHFRLALDAAAIGSTFETAARSRLRLADALQRPRELRDVASGDPIADLLTAVPESADVVEWPSVAGGVGGAAPMQDPTGKPVLRFTAEISAPGFEYSSNKYPMHLVGALDAVFLNRGTELVALHPLRQNVLWTSPSPLLDQNPIGVMREYGPSISGNMVLAAATGSDVVVAALQVPDASTTVRFMSNYTIMNKLPERRLFAFDRHTGKLLWSHFDQLDGPITRRFRGHAASGPPIIVGDTVYAPVHDRSGSIAFYIGAYDLQTGQPRWRRLVCSSQQEVNMFGNARREFAASPLCEKDGVLFGATNLGVNFAIEQASGRLRWVTGYDVLRMPETRLHEQAERPVFFQNNAPVICDGVACFTPLDSESAIAIDIETGERKWQLPHEARANGANYVRWLFGAIDGEFLFAGAGVVAARAWANKLELRLLLGKDQLQGDETGDCPRPAVSKRFIYYPAAGQVRVFDRLGIAAPSAVELRFRGIGNLLLLDGIALSLNYKLLEAAFDAAALTDRATLRAEQNPDDPLAILQVCTLRTAFASDPALAQESLAKLYRQGLEACKKNGLPKDQPPRSIFQRALFDSAMLLASKASGKDLQEQLLAARELAPDLAAFIKAQAEVLLSFDEDRAALMRELQVLTARAGDRRGEFRDAGGTLPVIAYVQWRLAELETQPGSKLLLWQSLLEEHPAVVIQQRSVRDLAQTKIALLLQQHGKAIYTLVEARANAALTAAGEDRVRLQSLGDRFPHSEAGKTARARLLDISVSEGDLANACEVLAAAERTNSVTAGLLRRVIEAARLRGNSGLARALAQRLQSNFATEPSDWPADQGKSYGEAIAIVLPALLDTAPPAVSVSAPESVLATIANPTPRTVPRLLPLTMVAGFAALPDAPLYMATASDKIQLRAIDLVEQKHATLFIHELEQLPDHLWLCGNALIVFDAQSVQALNYRTGELFWQLPQNGFYECFGVIHGVLLLTRQAQQTDGEDPLLLGIEPTSGRQLFSRVLPASLGPAAPKGTANDLLWLRKGDIDGAAIERIDPLTGQTRVTVPIGYLVLQQLSMRIEVLLQALLYPQELAADDEHIYLKSEPPMSQGKPSAIAVKMDGQIAWHWTGSGTGRLMLAKRGEQIVLAEGLPLFAHNQNKSNREANRVHILRADNGEVLRTVELGDGFLVRNWQRAKYDVPMPAALLGEDSDPTTTDRRIVCIGLDDNIPTFVEPFGAEDDDMVQAPLLGNDLVVFAHRPDRGGNIRVFGLQLSTRRGALLSGNKFLRLRGPVSGMGQAGAYTAIASQEGLILLGKTKNTR